MIKGKEKLKLYYKAIMELGLYQLQKKTSSDISTTTFKIIQEFLVSQVCRLYQQFSERLFDNIYLQILLYIYIIDIQILLIIYVVLTIIKCKYMYFKEMKVFRLVKNFSDYKFKPLSILFDDSVGSQRKTDYTTKQMHLLSILLSQFRQ